MDKSKEENTKTKEEILKNSDANRERREGDEKLRECNLRRARKREMREKKGMQWRRRRKIRSRATREQSGNWSKSRARIQSPTDAGESR